MSALHPCERVGPDFIANASFRVVTGIELPVLPAQLFEVLTDVEAWPRWFEVVTEAGWISSAPHGVGSTRTVVMRGQVVATEEFIVWDADSHLVFRFNQCSNPRVRASAEEYRIEPTSRGCRLTWTVAQDPSDASWFTRFVARRVMNRTYRQALVNLRTYTDRRFGIVI
ncbi:SRPBCC family protein [Mycolicibacterium sp. GCM10028919]|uniref:SRPBCC family protein n=1 Tax=Mycolicibacterium sp. GCM10028919 TaxID=3273401 RepID=UPI0036094BC2